MPKDESDRPLEVILNPLTVISRCNPAQIIESALGKVAAKTGKSYNVSSFSGKNLVDFALKELERAGLKDKEILFDPEMNREIPDVLTGNRYFMKLHHTAESKSSGRGLGGYTAEGAPAQTPGEADKPKRVGFGVLQALIGHGATENIKDLKNIAGQRNDDYWKSIMMGYTPPSPKVPDMYRKFLASLQGAGINVKKKGSDLHLSAMTDKDVNNMSAGAITEPSTVKWLKEYGKGFFGEQSMQPIKGGLFDRGITGGHGGCFTKTTHIWTEDGIRTIGDIVDNKLQIRVWSYDFNTNQFVLKPVIDWFKNKTKEPPIDKKVNVARPRSKVLVDAVAWAKSYTGRLIGTGSHAIYDIKGNPHALVDADKAVVVCNEFTPRAKQVFVATLLSGHLSLPSCDGPRFRFHRDQEEYCNWVIERIKPLVRFTEKRQFAYSVYTRRCDVTLNLTKNWRDRTARGRIILHMPDIKKLRPFGLALWFMSSGIVYRLTQDDSLVMHLGAKAFSESQVQKLCEFVKRKWNIDAQYHWHPKLKHNLLIQNAESMHKLYKLVAPFIPEFMWDQFKELRREYPEIECGKKSNIKIKNILQSVLAEVPAETNVYSKYLQRAIASYDIEVADTHNYFANRVLVSNSRWSHINLSEPMPQPTMEDPIRTLLGLTKKQYEAVVSGEEELPGFGSGSNAIRQSLKSMDLENDILATKEAVQTTTSGVKRDKYIKRLKYLDALRKTGVEPEDLVVTKVPVLPPLFRPITATKDFTVVSGMNRLYTDLMQANDNLDAASKLGEEGLTKARANLYRSFKAVTGLGQPVSTESINHEVKGLLADVFGNSPKLGVFQRKLLGTPVDLAARAAITPNPDLDMDQVGIPKEQAWQIYAPFVVRRLVRTMPDNPESRKEAIQMVMKRTPRAQKALAQELESRPVLITRAPALHKYSMMAAMPVLTNDKTMQLSPPIVTGLNADYDGDTMNFHVTLSDRAAKEAKDKMLPSKALKSPSDFDTMWTPRQEFLQGLYRASTMKSGKKMTPKYKTLKEVIQAFRRGELNIEDVVSVIDQ